MRITNENWTFFLEIHFFNALLMEVHIRLFYILSFFLYYQSKSLKDYFLHICRIYWSQLSNFHIQTNKNIQFAND